MSRKGKGRATPIMLDIKLQYIGKSAPTEEMVVGVLEQMLATGGECPSNWQFAAMDWSRPGGGSRGFRSGSIGNFAQFAPIIHAKLSSLKVRMDRRPKGEGNGRG